MCPFDTVLCLQEESWEDFPVFTCSAEAKQCQRTWEHPRSDAGTGWFTFGGALSLSEATCKWEYGYITLD